MVVLYILLGFFVISTSIFVFLYIRSLDRLKKIVNEVLTLNVRKGYYDSKVDLIDSKDSNKTNEYCVIVYVTELDRYTNGISKISLDKIEVISGVSISNYNFIKEVITSKFCSIKETSDIEWIESENTIKNERKEKLNKILKK